MTSINTDDTADPGNLSHQGPCKVYPPSAQDLSAKKTLRDVAHPNVRGAPLCVADASNRLSGSTP